MGKKKAVKKSTKKVTAKSRNSEGICAAMVNAIPTGKGKTCAEIHAGIVKKFPDRPAASLLHTLRGVFAGLTKDGTLIVEKPEGSRYKVYSRKG